MGTSPTAYRVTRQRIAVEAARIRALNLAWKVATDSDHERPPMPNVKKSGIKEHALVGLRLEHFEQGGEPGGY